MKKISRYFSTTHIVLLSFLALILLGSVLLSLPISAADGKAVPYIDALFTATTATCVTGLVTVPTVSTWSVFGQIVILLLIQIGGLGVITVLSGFVLLMRRRLGTDRRVLLQDAFNLNTLGGIGIFVQNVICGTLLIESIGALLYMTVFVPEYGARGIWVSVFTAVSAFCNAGIDIFALDSLCSYALHPVINLTTTALIILGGLGYVVWWDVLSCIRDKKRRGFRFLSLHSKIALCMTLALLLGGTAAILVLEYNNPATLQGLGFFDKLQMAFFQSVTVRTAGFFSMPQQNMTDASALVSMILMFIGGSPVSTAGGIKTVTVCVLLMTAFASVCNKNSVDVFDRQLSQAALKKAVAVFAVSFITMLVSALLLLCVTEARVLDVLYEAVSATATVGLSRGITEGLNTAGKAVLVATMYFGRVGPISLAVALNLTKGSKNLIKNPIEEVSIG